MSFKKIPLSSIIPEELFGNDAADLEIEDLFNSYAIERADFSSLYDLSKKMLILFAYKGEGKSAALRLIKKRYPTNENQVCVEMSAPDSSPNLSTSDSEIWQTEWKKKILSAMAGEIGSNIDMAWDDDSTTLVEFSEKNGFKKKSFVGYVTERLSSKYKPTENRATETGLHQIIHRYSDGKNIPLLVVIDDVDMGYKNDPTSVAKTVGLLNACRFLHGAIPDVRLRITIRPNTWKSLVQKDNSLSHLRQYLFPIGWTDTQIRTLLITRIVSFYKRSNIKLPDEMSGDSIIELIFEPEMDWGNRKVKPYIVLDTLSKNRPRWLVELCKMALETAKKRKLDVIKVSEINSNLKNFGTARLDDTIAEFTPQCSELNDLLAIFKGQEKTWETKTLVEFIRRQTHNRPPQITGVIGKPNQYEIAHFLYQIGFLSAREQVTATHYDHFAYAQDSNYLLNEASTPKEITWEIHPVYAQALDLQNRNPVSGAKFLRKE